MNKKDYISTLTLLTLVPNSSAISATADFFSISEFLVRRARILNIEKCVMTVPGKIRE